MMSVKMYVMKCGAVTVYMAHEAECVRPDVKVESRNLGR